MITTNLQSRLQLMLNCTHSLKKHDHKFGQKIMSVDLFPDGIPLGWYTHFQTDGWNVLSKKVDPKGSMILNQRNAISAATANIVLYLEDDILINRLPKLSTIHKVFNEPFINGKKVGFICFNNHVFKNFNENPKHVIDFIHDLNNYITIDGDVFLIKNEKIRDQYYLNFPASITSKKLFFELEDYAFINKKEWALEQALTSAWFDTGKDKEYVVLISLKPDIIADIKSGKKVTVLDFYNYANINFWNNDVTLRHEVTPGRKVGCYIVENMTGK